MQRVAEALGISISHAKNLDKRAKTTVDYIETIENESLKQFEKKFVEKYNLNLSIKKNKILIKVDKMMTFWLH